VDKRVGQAYEVVRPPDEKYPDFPLRVSYLIGPDGVIRRSYTVTDVGGHADTVLADLAVLNSPS
jgi:peroxiredoxin